MKFMVSPWYDHYNHPWNFAGHPVRLAPKSLRFLANVGGETDAAALWGRCVHQIAYGREDGDNRLIVVLELVLQVRELTGQGGVRSKQTAQLHEGTHDVYAHLDGARAVKHVGGLDGAVFSEGVWQIFDITPAA